MSGIRTSPELLAVARRWFDAVPNRRADQIGNLMSESAHLSFVGTDENELWTGQAVRDGVADFFGAERNSLGKYVTQEAAVLRFSNTWSAVVVASLMGLIFYGIIVLAERYSMPWVRATKE